MKHNFRLPFMFAAALFITGVALIPRVSAQNGCFMECTFEEIECSDGCPSCPCQCLLCECQQGCPGVLPEDCGPCD
jgi:hypothetical protein